MNSLSFQKYYVRFKQAALRQRATLTYLSNGGYIAQFGTGPSFAIMSGLHGDEVSGPLAILEWLENLSDNYKPPSKLWIAPLINDDGWNKKQREWHNIDLNRSFNENAPNFLKEIMTSLKITKPYFFLDLHEDSDLNFSYIYQFINDKHSWTQQLASSLDIQIETWSDFASWETASEIYIRRLGCDYCFTLEASPALTLQNRIKLHINSIVWLENNIKVFFDTE